jgi:hypothetical protein
VAEIVISRYVGYQTNGRRDKVMPASDANFLDTVLFIAAAGAVAVVVFAILFGVMRHRADEIRKHLRK